MPPTAGARFVRLDVEDNGPGLQGRGIELLSTPLYSIEPEGMGMRLAAWTRRAMPAKPSTHMPRPCSPR